MLAMTWAAWGFLWVAVSLLLGAMWCAATLITEWRIERRARRRRARRGGYIELARPSDPRLPR